MRGTPLTTAHHATLQCNTGHSGQRKGGNGQHNGYAHSSRHKGHGEHLAVQAVVNGERSRRQMTRMGLMVRTLIALATRRRHLFMQVERREQHHWHEHGQEPPGHHLSSAPCLHHLSFTFAAAKVQIIIEIGKKMQAKRTSDVYTYHTKFSIPPFHLSFVTPH